MRYRRRRNTKPRIGLLRVVAIVVTLMMVACLDSLNVFVPFDGYVYDCLLSLQTRFKPQQSHVCVVYVSPDQDAAEYHTQLLRRLHERNVRAVAYVDVALPPKSLDQASIPSDRIFQSVESGATDRSPTGSIDLLAPEFGIYRQHYGHRNNASPSLEWQVARQLKIQDSALPQHSKFDINYRGGPDSLPNVFGNQVVAGEITDNFFTGRVVLVGRARQPNELGLVTPTTSGHASMSRVEIHAHCLNTLLNETAIYRLRRSSRLLCYAACVLLPFLIVHHSPFRRLWWNASACIMLAAAVCWIEFSVCNYRFPMVGMVASQGLVIVTSLGIRFANTKRTLEHLEIGKSLEDNNQTKEDFWTSAGNLIYQYYYCQRLAILELPVGSNYLQVVNTTNCAPQSISELRRDFRRPPFCDAAELCQPCELDTEKQSFFVDAESNESQIIVPLMVTSNVVGFVVAGIHSSAMAKPDFHERIQKICDEVASAVEDLRKRSQDTALPTLVMFRDPEQEQLQRIVANEKTGIENQRHYEDIIEGTSTAIATFDPFGRLLTLNRRMREQLKDSGVVLTDISLLATVEHLSQLSWNECRRHLRRVFFDRSPETLVVRTDADQGFAVMHIRPISGSPSQCRSDRDESGSHSFRGIQVEYSTEHAWQSVIADRQRIVQQMCKKLCATIEQVRGSALDPVDSDEFDCLLDAASQDLLACQGFLASHREHSAQACLPVSLSSIVDTVVDLSRMEIESRGLELRIETLESHELTRQSTSLPSTNRNVGGLGDSKRETSVYDCNRYGRIG